MGDILKGKYPAKAHAKRVADLIIEKGGDPKGVLYLEGKKTQIYEDSDQPVLFRQRRHFYYLSGCDVPDCYLTYSMGDGILKLYIPPIHADEVIWSGLPLSVEEATETYDIDGCGYTDALNTDLADAQKSSGRTVYVIPGQVSDHVDLSAFSSKDTKSVKGAIETSRVRKDEYEVAMIRHANAISSDAHAALMKAAPSAKTEQELEAVFLKACIERGGRYQAYDSIVAAGTAGATLHYNKNNAPLKGKMNLLIDAGAEYRTYASDITRSFPINGSYSPESRAIYDIVLEMQNRSFDAIKAGMIWDDVHAIAHRVAIKGLLDIGILTGGTVDEIFAAKTSVAFFPHGLGHHLGMDTHDCGGNPNPNDPDPMFRYLRLRGHVPEDAVVTVEPGIYFCRFIIEPYLKDEKHKKYIDANVLEKYWVVGGIRIEDNVLVTKDGHVNLTTAPKTADAVEALIKGA
ncbi:putative Xaa-Pro aminopeptidase [Eremomyces bilateralis CBS 781.70]|uniref:Xaa-Pro aminopeptidase n=1 Tax=Eremomyces bilateralis CBS 781.70 TaxID=1392243 RepID=A0A6G1G5H8_9PEZI|nr:putative Xaa-Pro aminopeptidase [Eremomyces bilateralis CBS 781.70]KAF1813150.1 putative Xaa-Pro aminopeptidase [Eremomyces bilateralis CBS 781.70]